MISLSVRFAAGPLCIALRGVLFSAQMWHGNHWRSSIITPSGYTVPYFVNVLIPSNL